MGEPENPVLSHSSESACSFDGRVDSKWEGCESVKIKRSEKEEWGILGEVVSTLDEEVVVEKKIKKNMFTKRLTFSLPLRPVASLVAIGKTHGVFIFCRSCFLFSARHAFRSIWLRTYSRRVCEVPLPQSDI